MTDILFPKQMLEDLLSTTKSVVETIRKIQEAKREQLSKRDWEIVGYYLADAIFRKGNDGYFRCDRWNGEDDKWTAHDLEINQKGYKIHSVRRLSDGEVFSVGDEVDTKGSGETEFRSGDLVSGKIREIVISKEFEIGGVVTPQKLTFIIDIRTGEEFRKYIENIRRTKKSALFITEDSIEITDGEAIVYYIDENIKVNTRKAKNAYSSPKCKKIYAKAENAYDYILRHRTLLSLDDLLSAWHEGDVLPKEKEYYAASPMFKVFEQLAKSKMDKK